MINFLKSSVKKGNNKAIIWRCFMLCFIIQSVNAQDLTISTAGETGTSGTNWSIIGNELRVTGTATVRGSVIANLLATGNVLVKGNSTTFNVTFSGGINNSATTNSITIGEVNNNGFIVVNAAISTGGDITFNSGSVDINSNITSTVAAGQGIQINAKKITQRDNTTVSTQGANINYNALHSPFLSALDNAILINGSTSVLKATINANGGAITLHATFASTGVEGTGANPDRAISLIWADIKTSGQGTITIIGDATNVTNTTASAWGIQMSNTLIQTASGAIDITGTGGKATGNCRGIGTDQQNLKILSQSGTITINELKPIGLTGTYNGFYIRPNATTDSFIGADGSIVASSSSSIIIKSDKIDLLSNTRMVKFNTSGTITFESNASSFEGLVLTGLQVSGNPSSFTFGKITNTANITLSAPQTVNGPISIYGGTITLDADLTTTNNGNIALFTDNPLGGLSTPRTLTAAGAFKYIPIGTSFTADIVYPITNLTATSTGLTIGNATNDKNITINADVTGGAGIELYGNNLAINANLKTTNGAAMTLKGNATIAAGKYIESAGNFTQDGTILFKSDATATASFGTLGGTYTTTSGTVTVERFIPARRAYRFLSPAVTTSTTIRQNWQENGGTAAGLGTHITGATGASAGFDATETNNPSMFTFTNGIWEAVTNTNSNVLTAGTPYRLMVRGDRTISMATNTPTATNTTLRATGALYTGNFTPTLNQASEGYSFIGNPYQAPVDMEAALTTATNMNSDILYYWDPTLNTRGGYVTRTIVANSNNVTSDFTEIIQPGQAVFVKKANTGSTATLTIAETHKVVGQATAGVFRTSNQSNGIGLIRANLQANINNQWQTTDAALALFDENYTWELTQEDASKMSNLDEEVSFVQNNTSLAIACQSNPSTTSELPLKIEKMRHSNYQWQFELDNYEGERAYLFDVINNSYTEITHGAVVPFTADANTTNRFKIVFQNSTLDNDDFANNIKLYPNPAKAGASFYIDGITEATVSVYNVVGQNIPVTVMSQGNAVQVTPKTALSQGVYLVTVTTAGKTAQVKWIVE